ncbi:MAG TPA: helix-turn-helix transcriptional regulator [Gaiellaceae bacterium]|nr:helix-turn-helix transcriptional regulator [Gaiellaceae bacterium]
MARIGGRAPARLTESERRIAALVAQGRTNREVAAALFVTEHTVASFCDGQTVRQVAGEFEVSEEPKAAAEGFTASFEPEQRKGAYEGCYDGLLGKPPRTP